MRVLRRVVRGAGSVGSSWSGGQSFQLSPLKGQMNQNLNIFSLAILKRRNVKQNIQKETYAEMFLYEP